MVIVMVLVVIMVAFMSVVWVCDPSRVPIWNSQLFSETSSITSSTLSSSKCQMRTRMRNYRQLLTPISLGTNNILENAGATMVANNILENAGATLTAPSRKDRARIARTPQPTPPQSAILPSENVWDCPMVGSGANTPRITNVLTTTINAVAMHPTTHQYPQPQWLVQLLHAKMSQRNNSKTDSWLC